MSFSLTVCCPVTYDSVPVTSSNFVGVESPALKTCDESSTTVEMTPNGGTGATTGRLSTTAARGGLAPNMVNESPCDCAASTRVSSSATTSSGCARIGPSALARRWPICTWPGDVCGNGIVLRSNAAGVRSCGWDVRAGCVPPMGEDHAVERDAVFLGEGAMVDVVVLVDVVVEVVDVEVELLDVVEVEDDVLVVVQDGVKAVRLPSLSAA